MRKIILTFTLVISTLGLFAQKQITREAYLRFHSETPVEDITATTNKASSVIDLENGEFVCQVLMKSFHFEKALMEEHFNENYVESEKYPKAVFKGKIEEWKGVLDLTKNMTYSLNVKGTMTMHGVNQEIETDCSVIVKDGKVSMITEFELSPNDFNIEIPSAVADKISSTILVTFKANYNPI